MKKISWIVLIGLVIGLIGCKSAKPREKKPFLLAAQNGVLNTKVCWNFGTNITNQKPLYRVIGGNDLNYQNWSILSLSTDTNYFESTGTNSVRFFSVMLETNRDVTFVWNLSSDTNIAGYVLYYGFDSQSLTNGTDVGNKPIGTITNLNQTNIPLWFALTQYDKNHLEGPYSPPLIFSIADRLVSTRDMKISQVYR